MCDCDWGLALLLVYTSEKRSFMSCNDLALELTGGHQHEERMAFSSIGLGGLRSPRGTLSGLCL
jgi:hypothetical protein